MTRRQILDTLTAGAETVVLPYAVDLYPRACLTATTDAFADRCTARLAEDDAGETLLELTVLPAGGQDRRRVIGEFLNELLLRSFASGHGVELAP
jgi:hypothetical protein